MDVCRPSSDSRRSASKKVPHKVLLVGRQAQQYRVLLANKQKTQAVKLVHKNVLSHPPQQMPHMNSHMRPPAPVYRAGVPQMPVRYMTTPSGMSVCTSPHQMMTDEIHTFPHMPSNYEYPDGSHLANGRYHLEDGPPRYYHMVEQYDKQPRWESHPQNPRMYENTKGPNGFTPRMPAPKQYVQRGGQIYDQAQPFMDGYDQHRQQMSQMEYSMRNEASQQGYYDDQESVPSSPVKFLKSGNSTPGQKRRSYDEPHTEEEYENRQVENARAVRQNNVEQKLKSQKDTSMNGQQRNEEIRNPSESTLDFRGNAKTKVEEQYHQKQDQFQEKIYDSHPNPRNMPQNRSETPDDCFPPPPRSTSTNNFEQQQNRQTSTQNWQPAYNPNPKMVLNKDSYENTLERAHCPQEPENSKMPPSAPPRPAQNKNTHADSSKQFKPVAEQRKQVNPPARGYAQNLQQVELNPLKHVSTEKKELENWSQLVPHSKVAAVVQMLNQKEATNGIFPTGTQTKNKQPQSGSTPQLQRAITQKSQFVPPSTPQRPPNQESFTSKHQEIINQSRESPPHLQQESPQLPPKQAMLQRNQHSNFVPYNQQTQVQQVYQHQQRGQQETNMFQQQQQQYYHEDQHEVKQRLQQKPIPLHRNSTVEDYHKESPRMARNQNERVQQEPAKVSNNPPPAPPLPEGGVLKPSASRKNSLNPSASNVDLPNANIKNRSPQQSQNIHEAKSTGTVSISTDSALSSDDYTNGSNKPSIQGDSTLESTHDLNTEAELLLQYFKNNQHVLNYLGIGIPDDLWQHIRALPDKKVKLKVYEEKPTGNRKNPRTQGGKVVRRVSSRGRADKLEKRNRRKSNLQMRQEDERKRDSFLAGQAVAFGNAVISISKGPYPGYAGQEEVEKVMPKIPPPPLLMDKRAHPEMKATEKQIVRDFNDLSRQMNASDTSIILHKDGTFPRIKLEHRPHPPINRNISMDSLTEDELLKQSNDELEDRRSLKHDVTDGEGESTAKWNFLKKSGRFVKKSAAALIAKKQNSNTNSPVPTMKVANIKTSSIPRKPFPEFKHAEYRIAEEIANLREREDELRRNRNALGLPSLDDIVDTWRHGQDGPRMVPHPRHRYHYEEIQGSPLRGAQSFDHLHIRVQEGKQDFDEYDGTGYTIGPKVAKSESFHHLHSHMDEYYYEKNGHREQHYGTDQFTKQSRARRPPEPIQNMDAHTFADRVKMQTQDPRFQKAEQIKQINIKIHPAKRPERSDTLDSNRTAESRRSMRSGNSSQKKKRLFTYAMPVMRL